MRHPLTKDGNQRILACQKDTGHNQKNDIERNLAAAEHFPAYQRIHHPAQKNRRKKSGIDAAGNHCRKEDGKSGILADAFCKGGNGRIFL